MNAKPEQVYRQDQIIRWIKGLGGAVLASFMLLGVAVYPQLEPKPSALSLAVFEPISLGFACLALWGIFSGFRSRIEIYSDRIRDVGVIFVRELLFEDVAGFRIDWSHRRGRLVLMPNKPGLKPIRIDPEVERRDELTEWVRTHFHDLGSRSPQEEWERLLQEESFGASPEQRIQYLRNIKRVTNILNVLGFCISLYLCVLLFQCCKPPHGVAVWLAITLPFVALTLHRMFPRIVLLERRPPYPGVEACCFPSFILGMSSLLFWDVLNWRPVLIPFIGTTILVAAIWLRLASDPFLSRWLLCFFLVFYAIAHAFGIVMGLNAILDTRPPTFYTAEVLKKIPDRDNEHPYLRFVLAPWARCPDEMTETVSKAMWARYDVHDKVSIEVHAGRFGIPYYRIR